MRCCFDGANRWHLAINKVTGVTEADALIEIQDAVQ